MDRLKYSKNKVHQAKYETIVSIPQLLNNLVTNQTELVCNAPPDAFLFGIFSNGDYAFDADEVISDSIFKLAWHRIIVFEYIDTAFTIKNLYSYNGTDFEKVQLPCSLPSYQQVSLIATQAIDTCTLVCINAGNKYIMAHITINSNETSKMLACIKNELCNIPPTEINVFASYTDGCIEYDNEKKNLAEILNKAFEHTNFFPLLRNPHLDSNSAYLSHMEFGVCVEDSTVKYFGDITRHPSLDELEDKKKLNNWPCVTFECTTLNALSNLTQYEIKDQKLELKDNQK